MPVLTVTPHRRLFRVGDAVARLVPTLTAILQGIVVKLPRRFKKVCQNAKFDISVLRSIGIEVKNFYFDTMLASYCIDPDQKHGMDEL